MKMSMKRQFWQRCPAMAVPDKTYLAQTMLDEARKRVPDVEFALADCRELEALSRSFDAAAYAFGLSYLPDQDATCRVGTTTPFSFGGQI